MNLALFDFDGTITYRDSLLDFLIYSQSKSRLLLGALILCPILVLYKLGLMDNGKAKEIVISFFFKGRSYQHLQALCEQFSNDVLPRLIRKKAYDTLLQHIEKGDRVIIISASIENYLSPLATCWGVEVLATKLDFSDDVFTGMFSGKNCYGAEKVKRLKNFLELENFDEIYVYGDSKGDKEMLNLASKAFYKPFR